MASLVSILTRFDCILNSRQNCSNRSNSSKSKLVSKNAVKQVHGNYSLRVTISWTDRIQTISMASLVSILTRFNCILNSRQNCSNRSNSSKNKLVGENAVKQVHGSYSLRVMTSWTDWIQTISMASLVFILTRFDCILNSRQNCSNRSNSSKNKLVGENAVKQVHGSYSLRVMISWTDWRFL